MGPQAPLRLLGRLRQLTGSPPRPPLFVPKPDYPALAGLSPALGLVVSALALPGVVRPARAAALWRRFPRSVWPGRAMAVVAIAWFVLWLPFILLEFAPALAPSLLPWLQVLFLALAAGTLLSLQELLSCRAAGMLLVLLPTPLLSAAQWHPSPARYLVIAAAYAMAVCGMVVVARPWVLRDAILRANATPARARLVSALFLAAGLALLVCAAAAFPVAPGTAPLS